MIYIYFLYLFIYLLIYFIYIQSQRWDDDPQDTHTFDATNQFQSAIVFTHEKHVSEACRNLSLSMARFLRCTTTRPFLFWHDSSRSRLNTSFSLTKVGWSSHNGAQTGRICDEQNRYHWKVGHQPHGTG